MNINKYNLTLLEMHKIVDPNYNIMNRNELIKKVNEKLDKLDALQIYNLKRKLAGKIIGE